MPAMKTLIRCATVVAAATCLFPASLPAQSAQPQELEFPQPSPAATITQRVGLTDIEIAYSRPSARGRKIFGGLVPYGELWRTGANASTKVGFSTDVKLDGHAVPAGTYALFTIPGEGEWVVILHKVAEQWGTYGYDEAGELLRVKVKPAALSEPVETLRIGLDDLGQGSAVLGIAWERTSVSLRIETDLVALLVPKIEAAMAGDGPKPYYQAAMFYYENDLDLPRAAGWMESALQAQPDAVWMVYRYGLILDKAGDKEGALIEAKRALELAQKAGGELGEEYRHLSEALIARLQ